MGETEYKEAVTVRAGLVRIRDWIGIFLACAFGMIFLFHAGGFADDFAMFCVLMVAWYGALLLIASYIPLSWRVGDAGIEIRLLLHRRFIVWERIVDFSESNGRLHLEFHGWMPGTQIPLRPETEDALREFIEREHKKRAKGGVEKIENGESLDVVDNKGISFRIATTGVLLLFSAIVAKKIYDLIQTPGDIGLIWEIAIGTVVIIAVVVVKIRKRGKKVTKIRLSDKGIIDLYEDKLR